MSAFQSKCFWWRKDETLTNIFGGAYLSSIAGGCGVVGCDARIVACICSDKCSAAMESQHLPSLLGAAVSTTKFQ